MTSIEPPKIEQLRLDQLTPYAGNARRHPPEQIQQIADAIRRLGFLNPILVDSAGVIIAGHGRYEAAKLLALPTVPVVRLSDLTDEQARCMRIEDNALAAASRWDMSALFAEVDRLTEIADSSITGLLRSFDPAELFRDALPAESEPATPAPGASTGAADGAESNDDDDEAPADFGDHEKTAGPSYEANIIAAEPELIPAPPAGACVHPPDFSEADVLAEALHDSALPEDSIAFLRCSAEQHVFFQRPPDFSIFPARLQPLLRRCFSSTLKEDDNEA